MAWEEDSPTMNPEDKKSAQEIFEGRSQNNLACLFCAGIHSSVANLDPWLQPCLRIKRVDRYQTGELSAVGFWPKGEWEANVIFPEDVYDDDELMDVQPT